MKRAKHIKRITTLVTALLLLAAFTPAALAGGTAISLPDLKMTVEVPKDWPAVTRETPADDSAFGQIGITKDDWMKYAKDSNTYLSAVSQDKQSELVIVMESGSSITKAYDLNLLDEEQLIEFEQEMYSLRERTGKTMTKFQRAHHDQALFLQIEYTQQYNRGTAFAKEYVTIVNGQAISISMKSFAGEIKGDVGAALRFVMDTLYFTEITEKPKFDYSTMLYGMAGVLIFVGLALAFRVRIRRKNKKDSGDDDHISGLKNKYTRW